MSWEKQKEWQKLQEDNLLYVALTRSKSELYIVGEPDWFEKDERDESELDDGQRQSVDGEKDRGSENRIQQILELASGLTLSEKCVLLKLLTEEVNRCRN